jgi:hypothetical protein
MSVLVCLVLCLSGLVPTLGAPTSLKCVSWNINGAEKLKTTESDRKFLGEFDVIFLQETYSGAPESVVDLEGYIPHHQLGRPTLRRFQWGLSTLMRITSFVGGSIRRIASPVDWMVISRWQRTTDVGLLLINVYLPAHSDGFGVSDASAALAFIDSLRTDFRGDSFLIGGDINVDRYLIFYWFIGDNFLGFCFLKHFSSFFGFVFCFNNSNCQPDGEFRSTGLKECKFQHAQG